MVRSFYEGNSFGREERYSPEEMRRLDEDIIAIFRTIKEQRPVQEKRAVITAGAPGAGKTIILRQLLAKEALSGINVAYIDPDDVCLKNMNKTWKRDLDDALRKLESIPEEERAALEKKIHKDAYDKWRPGSNAANHLILGQLIRGNYAFYFGTTSSSPLTANTFKYLKELGYFIHLIHVIAPDDVRWESIKERDKTFVQTTEEDIREKGKLVPQRINDTFLKFSDQIDFYYHSEVKTDAVLTATWLRTPGEEALGKLEIHHYEAYKAMVAVHNRVCDKLEDSEAIRWENSVEKHSIIMK